MMASLGPYAAEVLSAYGVGLGLIFGLIILSGLQRRAARRDLRAFEDENPRG
ncbi:MAG: heme exporter protein CcmD [Pseudomonadota bacterium]